MSTGSWNQPGIAASQNQLNTFYAANYYIYISGKKKYGIKF